jgi:serine O-acetyltransferase
MENPGLFKLILSDYHRHEIPKNPVLQFIYFSVLLLHEGFRAVFIYRLFHRFRKVPVLNKLLHLLQILTVKIEIHHDAQISYGFTISHPQSVVIGRGSVIGKNATIHSGVVFGRDDYITTPGGGFPSMGDNVTVGTGAKIIGSIHIGDNCIIGANAVVTKNMPPNSVVAGVPARVLRTLPVTTENAPPKSETY